MLTKGQAVRQVLAHASVGGVTSVVQGGKFGHGFMAAGVTKGFTNVQMAAANTHVTAGVVTAAAIGGTVSEMTGGKFRNGANTAAMQFLFNAFASAQQSLAERNRRFREENGATLNPFKIIAERLPEWWRSEETRDLRVGVSATAEVASIPYKAVALTLFADDAINISVDTYNGNYTEAAINTASLIAGKTTVGFLKDMNFGNDMVRSAAGLSVTKATEFVVQKDNFNADR